MMNALKKLPGFAALLMSLQFAAAQPSGHATFAFDTADHPLWNLSGGYLFDTPLMGAGGEPVSLSYSLLIDHMARGPLRGEGTILLQIDGDVVAGFYTLRGSVSGSGNTTRANFSINIRGRDWISGAARNFNIKANYRLEVDTNELALVGTVQGNASLAGLGNASLKDEDVVIPLPNGVDGSWFVTMDFVPFKSFAGTGAIVVSGYIPPDNPVGWPTERTMQAKVKGNYKPKQDLTKAHLDTLYENQGAALTVTFYGQDQLNTVRGKVLGQTIKIDSAAP